MPPGDPAGPAPPRLSIDRDGTWRHEGVEITHERVLAYLWESLRVDAGGHYVRDGHTREPVTVEDAPFVVIRVELDGAAPGVILNDGSREPLAIHTLSVGPGGVPYCRVKGGAFAARLTRAAWGQVLNHQIHDSRPDPR